MRLGGADSLHSAGQPDLELGHPKERSLLASSHLLTHTTPPRELVAILVEISAGHFPTPLPFSRPSHSLKTSSQLTLASLYWPEIQPCSS